MAEPFELTCDALGAGALLVAFRGEERISAPFRFDVWATVPADAVPARDAVIGASATLGIRGNESAGDPLPTNGIVAGYQVVDEASERTLVRLELRPKLWRLGLSRHGRVFTNMKAPAILDAVLGGAGLDYRLDLRGSYAEEPHVCQYKESDLDFVQRLMEHRGMYYWFEHAQSSHTLVIGDDRAVQKASRGDAVRYQPVAGGDLGPDLFEAFAERRRLLPKVVREADYNYEKPSLAVRVEEQVSDVGAATVVDDPARALSPDEAAALAKLRKERLLADGRVFTGRGTAFHLRAGFTFELSEHPRLSAEYLCVELDHVGNARARTAELARAVGVPEALVYEVSARAIPASAQFRPALATPRPRVFGFERGTVDGPADSEYAQLDDQGRYLVKLALDETDGAGNKASVRMRMMQPHAGNPEGWHLPLRKGAEVMVAFVAGDPDRPVIAGAVPNAAKPSPVTSSNHTRNIFHSGSDNHLEIEDQDGSQWFDLRTPTKHSRMHLGKPHDDDSHHVVLHTDADCRFTIGGEQDIRVGGKLTENVKGNVTESYKTSQTSQVTGPQSTTVFGAVEETYKTGHKTEVTGKVDETYLSGQKTDVTGGQRYEHYEAGQSTIVIGGATHGYDKEDASVNGAPSQQIYVGPKKVTVTGDCQYNFDGAVTQLFGPTLYVCPSATWKSPDHINIFTPSWTEIIVTSQSLTGNVQKQSIVSTDVWNIELGFIYPLKFELMLIAVAAYGLKLGAQVINFGTYVMKINMNAVAFATKAVELTAAPLMKKGW